MPFWIKETSANQTTSDDSLSGLVSLTNIPDLLQFLALSGKSGMLRLTGNKQGIDGVIRIEGGMLAHVSTADYTGLRALRAIISIEDGSFKFTPGDSSLEANLDYPVQFAVMEAVRLNDEDGSTQAAPRNDGGLELLSFDDDDMNWDDDVLGLSGGERSAGDADAKEIDTEENTGFSADDDSIESNVINTERSIHMPQRDSTEVLSDLLKVPGIDAVVIAGRDGFVIETAGSSTRVSIDDLGAIIALTISGIEEMGAELEVGQYRDLFIEYGKAVILCQPIGDAVAAIIAPDASKLGIIRHKSKKLFSELAEMF